MWRRAVAASNGWREWLARCPSYGGSRLMKGRCGRSRHGRARRAFRNPAQIGFVVAVGALVAERRPSTAHRRNRKAPNPSVRMERDGMRRPSSKTARPTCFPVAGAHAVKFGFGDEIPQHVMGVVARDHVAGEEDRLIFRQEMAGVAVGVFAAVEQERHAEQPAIVEGVDAAVEALEKRGSIAIRSLPVNAVRPSALAARPRKWGAVKRTALKPLSTRSAR